MGLCKCPKRKVTNLFCFEHKVNVCEHCLVADHVRCIIKSYLQWLQDSDFDTACCICQDTLEAGEVVRLLCYDVLHVSCAEKFLLAYPPHTAPDGFFCPACHGPFLPPEVAVSPVADQLRIALGGMEGLQKRLHGLSAAIPEQGKPSPPTCRRPEPEGKEERDGLTHTDRDITVDRTERVSIPPSFAEDVPSEKDVSKDDPESDTQSSCSDFIATHPGSHARGAESDHRTLSPSPPLSSLNASTPASANFGTSLSTVENVPVIVETTSSLVSSFSAVDDSVRASEKTEVVVDVAGEDFTRPFGQSPVKSVSVMMEDPPLVSQAGSITFSTDASSIAGVYSSPTVTPSPIAEDKGVSASFVSANESRRETNVDMSWTFPVVSTGSTTLASGSLASAVRTKRGSGDSSALQHQASSTYSGVEYAESPPAQSPFSDSDRLSGANARSSSSTYIPRVPQSYPTSVARGNNNSGNNDHDDHKYRRKPLMEVVRTWLKIFSPPRGRRSTPSLWRRFVIIVLIAVLSLIGLVLLFHRLGRSGIDDDDPLLDLKANPFVKVDDS